MQIEQELKSDIIALFISSVGSWGCWCPYLRKGQESIRDFGFHTAGVGEREIVMRKTLVLVKSHIELNNE
jgi:hypothetical protein